MNRKHIRAAGFRLFITLALTAIALACITSLSCQLNPEGITILGGTYDCPKLMDFSIEGKNELKMTFSQEIAFSEMRICSTDTTPEEFARISTQPDDTAISTTANGSYQYEMTFNEDFDCGMTYLLYAVVEDMYGNSLSFSSDFCGFNDNLPQIALSEVRTEYSKPKPEYIELYVLGDGNLGGMRLEVFYSSKKTVFTFPSVDVHQGEYIVLHMRTIEAGSFDEADDTTVSTAADSCPEARDFWVHSESKTVGKTGVILLRERDNGPLVDALLHAESSKANWPNEDMKAAARNAFLSGVWAAGDAPANAVCSDKCTATRTLSRQDFSVEGASSWIVVATSSATPGAPNSTHPAQ